MASSFQARTEATTAASRSQRFEPTDAIVPLLTGAWAFVAFFRRDEMYDLWAVLASAVLLAATGFFYRWRAPPGRESFRLLGFFVLAQTFVLSGLAVIAEVEPSPNFAIPTQESFSLAVVAAALFGALFVTGAWLTGPRKRPAAIPGEPGPTQPVAVVLAVIATLVYVQFQLSPIKTGPLGVLPQIPLNLTLLGPMFMASSLLTRNSMRLPIAILLAGQAFVTFYSSSLMHVVFLLRDLALVYVLLGRRLPLRFIALIAGIVLFLNPVKMTFRNNVAQLRGGTEVTGEVAADFWKESIETTWGTDARKSGTSASIETTSDRLNYNYFFAHVHSTVPRRFAFENGGTYVDIPMMFVPRLIYPDKPSGETWTRARWLIKLGIQTERSAETTAVSLPTVAEAYWNFGWAGVCAIPALLGMLVGLILRFEPEDRVAGVGFVMIVVINMGVFIDMMVWIIPNLGMVAIVAIAGPLYSKLGRVRFVRSRAQGQRDRLGPKVVAERPQPIRQK